jgi:hypothetical protein
MYVGKVIGAGVFSCDNALDRERREQHYGNQTTGFFHDGPPSLKLNVLRLTGCSSEAENCSRRNARRSSISLPVMMARPKQFSQPERWRPAV